MSVYVIADVKVTDDQWIPDYAANVHNIVHKHDGKQLSRSANITTVEGEGLDTTLIALNGTDVAGTIPYLPKGGD